MSGEMLYGIIFGSVGVLIIELAAILVVGAIVIAKGGSDK